MDSPTYNAGNNTFDGAIVPSTNWSKTKRFMAGIPDGASNTVMVSEKYMSQRAQAGLIDCNQDQGYINGWDNDTIVWYYGDQFSNAAPLPSRVPAYFNNTASLCEGKFGSIHPAAIHVVFCDGVVRSVAYSVDPQTWEYLCKIDDGVPVVAPEG